MNRFVLALTIASGAVAPAFAQGTSMNDTTCEEYTALDAQAQTEWAELAVDEVGQGSADQTANTSEEMINRAIEACASHPELTVGESLELYDND